MILGGPVTDMYYEQLLETLANHTRLSGTIPLYHEKKSDLGIRELVVLSVQIYEYIVDPSDFLALALATELLCHLWK